MTEHPNEQEIFAKVAAAIAEQKSIDVEKVQLDSRFEELEVDSLDAMEILFELEEGLDVDIPDQAARAMRTVHDVVDGLGKLIRGEEIVLPEPPPADDAPDDAPDDAADDAPPSGGAAAAGG